MKVESVVTLFLCAGGGRMTSFWGELKRRNVVRVALAYGVVTWLLLQLADVLIPLLGLPDWAGKLVFLLLAIGFPLALFFAWAYELTPEGLRREHEVDRSQSITSRTGRRIDFLIIGVLVIAVGMLLVDKFLLIESDETAGLVAEDIAETPDATASIAVLPFVNMSSDEEQEYFSDGITEEILNALVAVEGLTVVGRTSSFAFKGKNEDLRNIGRALGADHLVEGSVRKSGVTVRITAQLVRADTGTHLWSETYDRDITDIFKVQDEISAAIAGALKITLLGAAERPATATVDPEVFDLYLRARHDLAVPTIPSLAAAVEKLQQVKRMDPGFLDARVELSAAFWSQANYGSREEREALALAEAEARAVLAIDPDFAGAYVALAAVSGGSNFGPSDPVAALAHMETAIRLGANTSNAWADAAFWRARAGDHAGARAALERAIALDPMNGGIHHIAAQTYQTMGAPQEAARSFARSIALQPTSGNWWDLGMLRRISLGDVRGAIEAYSQSVTLDPTDPEMLTPLAGVWLDIGDIEAASRAVARALDLAPDRGWSHWVEGLILRQQGRRREALTLMQASLDDPATVHRSESFPRLTMDVVRFHMEDGDFDAAEARLLKSYPDLLARLTPPANLRADFWRDPTALFIQVLRAKGEDEKAARLTPYTDTFSEDYFRRQGQSLTHGSVNWVLATAALAAGDDARALDYLQAAYEGGFVANWRSRYGAPDSYALWDHPRHKALMARIEADMEAQRAAMMAEAAE